MTITYNKQVILKRGNTAVSSTYTGPLGEITLDTDQKQIRIHDGVTAGGTPIVATANVDSINANIDAVNSRVDQVEAGLNAANVAIESVPVVNLQSISGNVLPSETLTYSLGNQSHQWKDLWVGANTIYIGGTSVSVMGNTLMVNGEQLGSKSYDLINVDYALLTAGNVENNYTDAPVITFNLSAETGQVEIIREDITDPIPSYAGLIITTDGTDPTWAQPPGESFPTNGVPLSLDANRGSVRLTVPPGGVLKLKNGDGNENKSIRIEEYRAITLTSTLLPFVELTNNAIITQPAVLGNPVTVTAAPAGAGASFQVDILEGSVLGAVTVTQAGTGYVVGQNYIIYSYQIGGPDDASNLKFTVDTVNESGGILTITNVQFVGVPANTTGSYGSLSIDYLPSVFDEIDTGVTLTRDNIRGLFNSDLELQYDNNQNLSPLGTQWNSDGWGDLVDLRSRSYTTLRSALGNQIGNNIIAAELVMYDTSNDKYYKFDFTQWGENSAGGFAYTRTEITDPNYFKKTDNGSEVDIIIADDGNGAGIGITRAGNNSIYNPYREEGYVQSTSPDGTLWNIDGWDDLSNVQSRTYLPFYAAYNGGLGNKVTGSRTVMYIPETGKYYAIQWLSWTAGGQGGGFSYIRKELDLTKLNEGVKFADGTILKSAAGVGRVKSTASGDRRIEEVVGSKTVSVTQRVTTNLTTVASKTEVSSQQVWIDITTTTIDDIIENPQNYGNAYNFQFSLDNTTWYNYDFGYSSSGNERGFNIWPGSLTYNLGDTVYFRYNTGGESVIWWDKADLPGGNGNFRGAIIDYHAYTGDSTIIGTIHIVDDNGEDHISHQEVQSGSTDGENDDLWLVTTEGQIRYRRIDGESNTLKVQWTAKVFYGSETYD